MNKLSSAKEPPPVIGEFEDLIPRPMLFPDEDPIAYEDLRYALLSDLAPGAPYERAIAENLVTLEWEAIRHRRMRDTLIKAKARDLAIAFSATGEFQELFRHEYDSEDERLGLALVGADRKGAAKAVAALKKHDISIDEIIAKAYSQVADQLELHEKKLAELETRRRRLREDYERLKSARAKLVEDAEIII
jgi:hypothetical protein